MIAVEHMPKIYDDQSRSHEIKIRGPEMNFVWTKNIPPKLNSFPRTLSVRMK